MTASPDPSASSGRSRVRTLIVDDERLARDRLKQLLASDSRIEIVGEAAGGREAVQRIRALRPDLLLLDVQMPGLDGFGVLREIGDADAPGVIFVTAHDEHALEAFEVEAVDYVLKPVAEARLRAAVRRAIERLRRGTAAGAIATLLERVRAAEHVDRVTLRDGDRVTFVAIRDIDRIDAEGDYARVRAAGRSYLVRETLTSLQRRLPAAAFARIHRSLIVALDRIEAIEPWRKGDYVVVLKDGTRVTTGPTYRERVRELFGD